MDLNIIIFALYLLLPPVVDQTDKVYELTRISSPITLDGIPEEAAWQGIEPLPLTMYQPVHQGEMTQRSEIKVAYDDEYFYISGKLYDTEPEKIVANTLYRDSYSGDETFAIILDTFNDSENARWFFVTPTGVRVDMLVLNDSEGDNSTNRDWNTYWDVETQITDEGWFAEIRIPFSSLGFEEVGGKVTMGMIVYRYIARNAERHIYPDIAPNWSRGFTKPSQARKITMSGIEYRKPIYVTPYLLGGLNQEYVPNGNRYDRRDNTEMEAGLDIKYPLSSDVTLDLTINTDFAQVEADNAQINLSRFPLFFPEKRQFFQERSDIFNFNTGGSNTLFYSRRIGLEQGNPVRILGGARVAGKLGKWDIGVLNMQTDALNSINLPAENFGVYRGRRSIINNQSHAGGIVTTRIGMEGSYNIGTGFDFLYNFTNNEFLDVKYAATLDDRYTSPFSFSDNGLLRINWERRTTRGLYYDLTAKRSGKFYDPGIGFESRNDYSLFDARVYYGVFSDPDSPIRILTPSIRFFASLRNEDYSAESMQAEHSWDLQFKDGSEFELTANWWYEDILFPLRFSASATVPAGSYSFWGLSSSYSMNSANKLRADISTQISSFYDGAQQTVSLSPTWNPSQYVEIGGEVEFNFITFENRDQQEYFHIYRLRSLLALNTQVSIQLLSQYNRVSKQIGTNARFRYNFREGRDFWVVFNETTNTQLNRFTPTLPQFDNRTVLVKYTHTFY